MPHLMYTTPALYIMGIHGIGPFYSKASKFETAGKMRG